jgi:hypothetical protein
MVEFRSKTNIKGKPMGLFVTSLPPAISLSICIGISVFLMNILRPAAEGEYLVGDYKIGKTKEDLVRIWNEKKMEIAVDGNIATVGVQGPYIGGYAYMWDEDRGKMTSEGYYLVNTATGEVKQGMLVKEWQSELKKIDWRDQDFKNVRAIKLPRL